MPGRPFLIALGFLFFLVPIPAHSQTVVSKDATAVNLLSRAVNVLTQGVPVNSITLTATVTRSVGPDVETGSATLEALGGAASRVSLALTDGLQTEIVNQSQARPGGQQSGTDGTIHPMALHNCLTPASWFFPALAFNQAMNDPLATITYVGQETDNGQVLQHIRFWRTVPAQNAAPSALAMIEKLSTVDVYLDASTNSPAALTFNTHPEDNANIDFTTEILYSNIQVLNGMRTPVHIQQFVNNTLLLDFYVNNLTVNTGLAPGDFALSTQ